MVFSRTGKKLFLKAAISIAALIFLVPIKSSFCVPEIVVGNAIEFPNNQPTIPISFTNDGTVTALQFELDYDSLAATVLSNGEALITTDHRVFTHPISADKVRVIVYSPTNAPISNETISNISFSPNQTFCGESIVKIGSIQAVDKSVSPVGLTSQQNGSLAIVRETFSFHFIKGWNLFSIPFDPIPDEILTVFQEQNAGKIWEWNVNQSEQPKLVTISDLVSKKGYWVYFSQEQNIELTGCAANTDSIPLKPGWNSLGSSIKRDIPTDPEIDRLIWKWNSTILRYELLQGDEKLMPGIGYWIFAFSEHTLTQ